MQDKAAIVNIYARDIISTSQRIRTYMLQIVRLQRIYADKSMSDILSNRIQYIRLVSKLLFEWRIYSDLNSYLVLRQLNSSFLDLGCPKKWQECLILFIGRSDLSGLISARPQTRVFFQVRGAPIFWNATFTKLCEHLKKRRNHKTGEVDRLWIGTKWCQTKLAWQQINKKAWIFG